MPKHVVLAMSIQHSTGSKQVVTMLTHLGHCSLYDEVETADAQNLAEEVLAKSSTLSVVVPSNINRGQFRHATADNNDLNEETLEGKKPTHSTTIMLDQSGQFGPKLPFVKHAHHIKKKDPKVQQVAIHYLNVAYMESGLLLMTFCSKSRMTGMSKMLLANPWI